MGIAAAGAIRADDMEENQLEWTADGLQSEYYDLVFTYFSRRVSPREEAEDLTAATFLAAFEQLKRFRRSEPPLLLFGIARRKLADSFRRNRNHLSLDMVADAPDPCAHADQELARELRRAVQELPGHWREPLLLQYLEDLSVRQISQVLGKSEKAVKACLQRARQKLRENPALRAHVEAE